MFNEPTEAKYVRLTGVETYGEGSQQNKFASAAEIRLRKADSKTDISDATVSLTNEKKLVSVVDKDHPVTLSKEDIEVTLGDKVLRYGIDYKLTYNNNEAPGTATAIVTGIGQYGYTGSQEVSFTIELKKPEMNNISIKSFPTKTTYKEGETLDPTGLVLTTSYDNGTTADVVYSEETAKDFAFNPDTKTALSKGIQK
jgi:beta-galactosidase